MTAQMTIRAAEELVDRVKLAAAGEGRSMNDYVTAVLDSATNPDCADSLAQSVRERLRRAGILADTGELGRPPVEPRLRAEAGRQAGTGTPLSQIVFEGR